MCKKLFWLVASLLLLLLAVSPLAAASDYEPPPPGHGDPIRVDGSMVVPSGDPGQTVTVTVPLYFSEEFGWTSARDISLTPLVSADPEQWPFEIKQTTYTQSVTLSLRRARPSFSFTISQQAKAGTYPISFTLTYVAANGPTRETKTNTINSYVKVLSDGTEVKSEEETNRGPIVLLSTPTPSAAYGERVTINLELRNSGSTLTDVTIKPVISTDLQEFPFVVEQQSYEQALGSFTGGITRSVTYDFLLSEYVSAGAKAIKFQLDYVQNGVRGAGTVTAYVDVSKGNDKAEDEGGKKTKPKLIISSYTIEPEKIYAGASFTLEMNFTNTSETPIQNLTIGITNSDEENAYVVPAKNGSNTIYVRQMAAGETIKRILELQVRPDTPAKPNMLSIAMEYEDEDFASYTTSANITVPINQEIRVVVDEPRFDMPVVDLGMSVYPYFSIINMGKSSIYNTMISVEGPGLSLEERAYVGTLQAGQQYSADIGIIPNEPGEIAGQIVVSFEDEYGDKLEERQPFTLTVQEAFMPPEGEFMEGEFPLDGERPGMMEGEGNGGLGGFISGHKWWFIGGGALLLLVLIIVLRKRRAKKRLAELTEDDVA